MCVTKYGFTLLDEVYNSDVNRLTNQLWKLIPMKENNENWLGQLQSVIVEISGLNAIVGQGVKFLVLLSKLEGLQDEGIEFEIYRKTVFEAITLLREL